MSRLSDLQLYFWLNAIAIGAFIYYKFKKMTDHVFNHYLYFISLMALLSRVLSMTILAIDPLTRINMVFSGICIISQGWLVFGTLALIQKRPAEQDHPNNRTQLAEDLETIKSFCNDPTSPKMKFIAWNVIAFTLFALSLTDYSKSSNSYGALFLIVSYFGTAWAFSQANRENLLPEASQKLDILVTGFIILGVIDSIAAGEPDYFVEYFTILQTAFSFFECMNIHNFSRLFNYNERISFVEFAQPRDTVNLDVSHRQEDEHQASPSVQELKSHRDDETQDEENGPHEVEEHA